jgi:trimethylamine--corrinoid protein Co-methyltransferase
MDMRTTITCYGGPVLMMSQAALGQISRYYNIPTFGFACVTDSSDIDAQCGMEMMWSALINAMAGLNLCHDCGYMNSGMLFSLESLLLSDEIISAVKFFMEGININEETLAVDLIDKIGPSGNYLEDEHTLKYFKKDGWYPRFLNRRDYEVLKNEKNSSVKEKLTARAQEILEEKTSPLISDDELKEIDKIIKNREKNIS